MSPGLVPDIHNDGLEVLRVPDELVQEAHAKGPRPNNQVVCCQLRHPEDIIVVSLSGLRFGNELTKLIP